ncbi:unnamed protein product [Effrenium voratum]|nr:unnamed protein product [Effrenium voratum]
MHIQLELDIPSLLRQNEPLSADRREEIHVGRSAAGKASVSDSQLHRQRGRLGRAEREALRSSGFVSDLVARPEAVEALEQISKRRKLEAASGASSSSSHGEVSSRGSEARRLWWPFSDAARGRVAAWLEVPCQAKGKKMLKHWWHQIGDAVDVGPPGHEDVKMLLAQLWQTRPGPHGSLADLFGDYVPVSPGVGCVPFLPCKVKEGAQFRVGWHGTVAEALYMIAAAGHLKASADESEGHRFFPGHAGVYLHTDKNSHLIHSYARFAPTPVPGWFFECYFKVLYDVEGSVKGKKKTNQVIQTEDSVHIESLWVAVKTLSQIEQGAWVANEWDPALEGRPPHMRSQHPAS